MRMVVWMGMRMAAQTEDGNGGSGGNGNGGDISQELIKKTCISKLVDGKDGCRKAYR